MDEKAKQALAGMNPDQIEKLIEKVVGAVAQELSGVSASSADADSCGCPVMGQAPEPQAVAPVANREGTDRMSVPHGSTAQECGRIAQFIDHTLLKPGATEDEVRELCREARQHSFASVCVNGSHVELVARELAGSGVKTCAVVGFPLGAMTSTAKAYEAADLIKRGADEIDMVINVGMMKSRDYRGALADLAAVRAATQGHTLKVILETNLLDDEEKRAACVLCKAANVDFVKTSTGFSGGGATVEDIALMRAVVGPKMGVKASGGIRTCEDAAAMIQSGATRLGASAGVKIVAGESGGGAY